MCTNLIVHHEAWNSSMLLLCPGSFVAMATVTTNGAATTDAERAYMSTLTHGSLQRVQMAEQEATTTAVLSVRAIVFYLM
jgi:hypothetical protein